MPVKSNELWKLAKTEQLMRLEEEMVWEAAAAQSHHYSTCMSTCWPCWRTGQLEQGATVSAGIWYQYIRLIVIYWSIYWPSLVLYYHKIRSVNLLHYCSVV